MDGTPRSGAFSSCRAVKKDPIEDQLGRIVNMPLRSAWAAFPDGHIRFFNHGRCEYTDLSVAEPWGCGRDMKNL